MSSFNIVGCCCKEEHEPMCCVPDIDVVVDPLWPWPPPPHPPPTLVPVILAPPGVDNRDLLPGAPSASARMLVYDPVADPSKLHKMPVPSSGGGDTNRLAYHFGGKGDSNNRYLKPSATPDEPDSPLNTKTKTPIMKDASINCVAVDTQDGDATTECEVVINGVGQGAFTLTGLSGPDASICVPVGPYPVVCGDTLSFRGYVAGTQPNRMSAHIVSEIEIVPAPPAASECIHPLSLELNANRVHNTGSMAVPLLFKWDTQVAHGGGFSVAPLEHTSYTPATGLFTINRAGQYRINLTLAGQIEVPTSPISSYLLMLFSPDIATAPFPLHVCTLSVAGHDSIVTHSSHRILNIFAADLPYVFECGYQVADAPPTETITLFNGSYTNISIDYICPTPQIGINVTGI